MDGGPAPLPSARPPGNGWLAPGAVVAGLGVAVFALAVRDPHEPGSWGFCPMLALTGLACPLCGGLSSVHDVATGDLTQAVRDNVLVVFFYLPLIAVWAVWPFVRWQGVAPPSPRTVKRLIMVGAALTVVFGVWRNTPWGAGLNPYSG